MRERLIELIDQADEECKHSKSCKSCSGYGKGTSCMNNHIADYLLANGVILPPCKVGDVVYRIYTRAWIGEDVVREVVVSENGVFYIDDKGRMTSCNKFGKTVFLTREDAERALRKEDEGK